MLHCLGTNIIIQSQKLVQCTLEYIMFILLAPLIVIQRGKGIKHCKNYSVGSVLAPSVLGWTAVLHASLLLHCCSPFFLFIARWYCLSERQACYKTVLYLIFFRKSFLSQNQKKEVCLFNLALIYLK